jgi:hypothetical protein
MMPHSAECIGQIPNDTLSAAVGENRKPGITDQKDIQLSLNQYYAICEPEEIRRFSEKINAASRIAHVMYIVLKIVVPKMEIDNPNSK